ncbi:MAG: hypothetical protein MI924_14740 [Chloroflexales bacterium]|nr:hypothetical protein [Chloroflexales bacterium]
MLIIGFPEVVSCLTFFAPERRQTGMVFQDYMLFPDLSIIWDIAYSPPAMPPRFAGGNFMDCKASRSVRPFVSRLSVTTFRVGSCTDVASRVLLFDELCSNLKAGLHRTVRAEVCQILVQEGASLLFVTHNQEAADPIRQIMVMFNVE